MEAGSSTFPGDVERQMKTPPKARTKSIKGDAHLIVLIDPFSFLEDLLTEENFLEEETPEAPDEGQCQ